MVNKLVYFMKYVVFVLMALVALPVHALSVNVDEAGKTVAGVGSHDPMLGYLYIKEGVAKSCPYNAIYFDISKDLGKSMLSLLISAKLSGTKVRIAYMTPPGATLCDLRLVELQ